MYQEIPINTVWQWMYTHIIIYISSECIELVSCSFHRRVQQGWMWYALLPFSYSSPPPKPALLAFLALWSRKHFIVHIWLLYIVVCRCVHYEQTLQLKDSNRWFLDVLSLKHFLTDYPFWVTADHGIVDQCPIWNLTLILLIILPKSCTRV